MGEYWDISGSWVDVTHGEWAVYSDARRWRRSLEDPFRQYLYHEGKPDLDEMLAFAPRPTVLVGMNPDIIRANVERLETTPVIDLGHPYLDLSIKTALAHIDATFQGDHPKYGTQTYASNEIDGFPQTIIAVVDALTAWGLHERAIRLWLYWLRHMVRDDGYLAYRAPCLGEYGQLLHTAALLNERAGAEGWWDTAFPLLEKMVEAVVAMYRTADHIDDIMLVAGSADEDLYGQRAHYFHTNAWLARGLQRWADLCTCVNARPSTSLAAVREIVDILSQDTLTAIRRTWPEDPDDWWLPPCLEPVDRPWTLTDTREASYTNYRYFPELLSSGILPAELANRIVEARQRGGGEFCGMSRFMDWTDNWPMAEYLYGLWSLERKGEFLYSLYGHLAYQQDAKHLTACEQLTFPPGRPVAPYCIVTQLVPARAARLLVDETNPPDVSAQLSLPS